MALTHKSIIDSVRQAVQNGQSQLEMQLGRYEDYMPPAPNVSTPWLAVLPEANGLTLSKFDVAMGVTPESIKNELTKHFGDTPLDFHFKAVEDAAHLHSLTLQIQGIDRLEQLSIPSSRIADTPHTQTPAGKTLLL